MPLELAVAFDPLLEVTGVQLLSFQHISYVSLTLR